ncbi:MAG: hypothetical protein LQ338_000546 [Usnochroma carphineum]|nr:MAG: hypothetical protein LQ338_000546 [Usnochroma carphineum]
MSSTVSSTGGPIYFFREHEHPYGFLSQWFSTSFTAPPPSPSPGPNAQPVTFTTTEQYMMYHKAMLFNDSETAKQIMLADTPKKQKALGRKVKNFDGEKWNAHREKIVEEGNWNKFCNSKGGTKLRDMLVDTGDREVVEASPFDRQVPCVWCQGP